MMSKSFLCKNKLLTHRLRGFSEIEHTPSALKAACLSKVPYLEVDARGSQDGGIFIYHNPIARRDINGEFVFSKTSSLKIVSYHFVNGEPLLALDDALQIFGKMRKGNQRLCIDIKDFGFEELYLKKVRKYGLEEWVYFISWIPQTIKELYRLGSRTPLIFSQVNITKLKGLGSIISEAFEQKMVRLPRLVILGKEQYSSSLGPYSKGYQHGYICQRIPDAIVNILSASGGGIGVHTFLVNQSLIEYCSRIGLQLWVFSTKTTKKYLKYATNPGIDVVFCDNAPRIYEDIIQMGL